MARDVRGAIAEGVPPPRNYAAITRVSRAERDTRAVTATPVHFVKCGHLRTRADQVDRTSIGPARGRGRRSSFSEGVNRPASPDGPGFNRKGRTHTANLRVHTINEMAVGSKDRVR